tara:strand:- start:1056 stop:1550 length:495 start_codon:yes stop_codon:yes gene_type:complete
VKKLLLFFILIYLVGCASLRDQSNETAIIDCPRVFFSSENNIYIDGANKDLDFEKVNYRASLNNFGFVGNCISYDDYNNYNLEVLILAEPMNPKNKNISLPIFVFLYDLENNLIDRQYFRVEKNLKYNSELSDYEITEVIANLNIFDDFKKELGSIIVGFVNIN